MSLLTPIFKKISIDTNGSLLSEEQNLSLYIRQGGTEVLTNSIFKEVMVGTLNSGVYYSDVEFNEVGEFEVIIKHIISGKSATSFVSIDSSLRYKDLEDSISDLTGVAGSFRSGKSFA